MEVTLYSVQYMDHHIIHLSTRMSAYTLSVPVIELNILHWMELLGIASQPYLHVEDYF